MAIIEIRDILNNETGETIFPRTHVNAVIGLKDTSFFEAVQDELDPTKFSVKLKSEYTGLWAEGWVASGGVGSQSGGGGGGSSFLNDLLDVTAPNPAQNDLLRWNGSAWVNVPQSSIVPTISVVVPSTGNALTGVTASAGTLTFTTGTFVNSVTVNQTVPSGTEIGSISVNNGSAVKLYAPSLTRRAITDLIADRTTILGLYADRATSDADGNSFASTYATIDSLNELNIITGITTQQDCTVDFSWRNGNITKVDLNHDHTYYVAGTLAQHISSKTALLGVTGISNNSAWGVSGDNSQVVWTGSAWHFKGNIYADGWIAAGGIGDDEGGTSGSLYALPEVGVTSPTNGQFFYYNGTRWVNTNVRTINGNSIIGSGDITIQGGGGTVTSVRMNGSTISPSDGVVDLGTVLTSYTETDPTVPSWAKTTNPPYIGHTAVQSTAQPQNLLGVPSINATNVASSPSRIVWTGDAWHFYGNIYADGWIAAGGVGDGGSGGGGVTSLYALDEVLSSTNPSTNQVFYFNGSKWTATTLRTVGGTSLIGSGNIPISGGGGGSVTSVAMTVPTGLSVSPSTITTSGTFVVSLDNGYVIPQQATLDNFVTLDGTQIITGAKTFTAPVTIDPTGNASSYIDIGNARLVYDSGANALHITKKSGTSSTIGLFADGFVAAGGVAGQTTISYVDLESNQTIDGDKSFDGTTTFNGMLNVDCPSTFSTEAQFSDGISLSGTLNGLSVTKDSNNYVSLRASRIDIQDNGSNLFLCRGSGKVFLCNHPGGTVSHKLYLDSSSTAIAQSWNTHSDFRLKEDIVELQKDDSIEKLMALKPSVWKWKSGLAKGQTASGFIAQEVEPIIPFMVTGDDYKGLAYQMLHAYEVSAIQSHEERIKILEKKMDKIEG